MARGLLGYNRNLGGWLQLKRLLAVSLVWIFSVSCGSNKGGGTGKAAPEAGLRPVAKITDSAPDPIQMKNSESGVVPVGTVVSVAIREVLDSQTTIPGTFGYATIDEDVRGSDGKIALPKGTPALLGIPLVGKQEGVSLMSITLYQFMVGNKSVIPPPGSREFGRVDLKEDFTGAARRSSVHLGRQSRVDFTLTQPIRLK